MNNKKNSVVVSNRKGLISPPRKIPLFLKLGIFISRKETGKDLLVPKLLAWYPKVAISSGILELLVANGKKDLSKRILKLIRIQTSLSVSCPFCIDMNSFGYLEDGISESEMEVLRQIKSYEQVPTFLEKEIVLLKYVKNLCASPIIMPKEIYDGMIHNYTEREIVIIASTVAQVNYWARLIQGLGVPSEGFMDHCDV